MNLQLLSILENSRNYTMAVAESMPETSYTFKPQGAGWNFVELLNHIAYGIQWWEENYVKGNKLSWDPPPLKNGKQDTINYLGSAYDSLKNTLGKQELTGNALNGFHSTIDHITHHRGQTVVYMRCNGINPPEYLY
jgi:uncharacterized damage-inducible protein DinB